MRKFVSEYTGIQLAAAPSLLLSISSPGMENNMWQSWFGRKEIAASLLPVPGENGAEGNGTTGQILPSVSQTGDPSLGTRQGKRMDCSSGLSRVREQQATHTPPAS